MPDGPLFSDEPITPVAPCRQPAKKKKWTLKHWDVQCVVDILCRADKNVVKQLATSTVWKADGAYWPDWYFDGATSKWKQKTAAENPAEGESDAAAKSIFLQPDANCVSAATTAYHEVWHQNQPPGMGWPHPGEDDAYYNTELWAIQRGLPPQSPGFRRKDAKGKIVPNKKAIAQHIDNAYPQPVMVGETPPVGVVAPAGVDPEIYKIDTKKNITYLEYPGKGTKYQRPSKPGDEYQQDMKYVNKVVVDKKLWKCP